jgi:ligand-binding sensor domain-containing protein/signal transduction histidine kinase
MVPAVESVQWQGIEHMLDHSRFSICIFKTIVSAFFLVLCWNAEIGLAADTVRIATVDPEISKLHVINKNDVRFRRIPSAGLSQTRVAQIVQDDDGYLWFGTQNGVSRYDGYRFQVLKHIQGDPDSLSGIYIYDLFKDRSGTIWVASDQFLDAFDKRTGAFRHYRIAADNPMVINISQDSDEYLWLATDNGLYRFTIKTGETKLFSHNPDDPASLSSNSVKFSGVDRDGTFWVAGGEGLEAFDRSTGKVTIRIPMREEAREFSFHEDAHGIFWIISSTGNGLALYDRTANRLMRYSFDDVPAESGLSGVHSLLETTSGEIWLATMGSGLLKFDRERFQFDRYRNDPTDPGSLKENRAISLFEDREGNIWTGLHASPPNMFARDSPTFRTLWPFPGHVDKLGETLVNAVFEDRDGAIWLGAGGVLNRIDPEGKAVRIYAPAGPGSSVEVLSIAQDAAGTLWIGTLGSGLYALNVKTQTFKRFKYSPGEQSGISSDTITRIYVEPSGLMWLSTWNGLNLFDPETGHFTTFKANKAAGYEAYFSLVPDGEQFFWLGTTEGFGRFDRTEKTFKFYKHDPDDPRSISNNTVDTVYITPDGLSIWVGTQNGLNKFDKETGQFKSYFESDGLAGNAVSCILGDDRGRLWMSTNQGISKFDPQKMQFENYSMEDGLPGDDFTGWDACTVGRGGNYYFGGFAGATVRAGEDVDRDLSLPPVVFTDFQIGNEPKTLVPSSSYVKAVQPIMVSSNTQYMAVGFSAPNFTSPRGTRYRYQLSGFDDAWHIVNSNERTVSFATLPAGDFTLIVEAATKRGNWGNSASLKIRVLPKWWYTWWFIVIVSAAMVASLAALYRLRLSQIAARYDLRFRERMNERNRVARDLHDTLLQSLQGLTFRLHAARNLLPDRPGEAASMLDIVLEKSDDAITEGRNAVQALRDSKQNNENLLEALTVLGQELAATQSLDPQPKFDIRAFGPVVAVDPIAREEVYRIVAEALRNAFRHSGAKKIECSLYFSTTNLRIIVTDDGEGVPNNNTEVSNRRGWGIAGMKERAEKIGAHFMLESLSGRGTRIELLIALRNGRGSTGRPKS